MVAKEKTKFEKVFQKLLHKKLNSTPCQSTKSCLNKVKTVFDTTNR